MADITIGSAASLPFAVDARQALTTIGRARAPTGIPPTEVPIALAARRSGGGVPLNVADARTAISVALIAGLGILDALESLADAFRLATDRGLISSNTRLIPRTARGFPGSTSRPWGTCWWTPSTTWSRPPPPRAPT